MRSTVDWTRYRTVSFDPDGVITPTAEIHARAWVPLFERWEFTPLDHLTYVDGKPSGVAAGAAGGFAFQPPVQIAPDRTDTS